jgi:hypothetical protein
MKNICIYLLVIVPYVCGADYRQCPYVLPDKTTSRSISFENIKGGRGEGAMASNSLGVGRKGSAYRWIEPGESIEIFNVEGSAVIHHIWCTPSVTMDVEKDREIFLGLVIRAYWEKQEYPSIEAPLGNFFGIANGRLAAYESDIHSVNPKGGLNLWAKMPFHEHGRITITNESPVKSRFFFNIDYTINESFKENFGRLHCLYRRENPTTLKKDFEILPLRHCRGRYLGCLLGIRLLDTYWWGEGEFKVYLDGDEEFPTIAGTGMEDYIGHSYGIQDVTYRYGGCAFNKYGLVTLYRWHSRDPIFWHKDVRITVQQIGNRKGYYERSDDYNVTTFWYEPIPSEKLPQMPPFEKRVADYEPELINIQDAIEFENMKKAHYTAGRATVIATDKYWGRWSGNKLLLWRDAQEGDTADFEFTVDKDGEYFVNGNFFMNRNSPKLEFYVDDIKLVTRLDNYDWTPRPSFSKRLGCVNLSKGSHKLTVKIAGADPAAIRPFEIGMDYILLEKRD